MPESHQVGSSKGAQFRAVHSTEFTWKTFTSDFALGTLVQLPRGGPELKLRQCLPNMVVFQSLVHVRVTPGR